MLTLDPEKHEYRYNGAVVPSVTQVIGEWTKVDIYGAEYYLNVFTGRAAESRTFRRAAEFGRAVHLAAELIISGHDVDFKILDAALRGPVNQFIRWMGDYRIEPIEAETLMYSEKYGYAGRPDLVARMRGGKLIVCDFKTGAFSMAGPQTAGYEQLYRERAKWRGHLDRYALHLPKDGGTYSFQPFTAREDWDFFKVRLYQHRFLQAAGRC